MKPVSIFLAVSLLLFSCLSENGVKSGDANTFVRFYNGGNNDQAVQVEELPDKGFIILGTTKVQKAEADIPNFKIKLTRTDQYGNPLWTKLFPDITEKQINYTASSLQLIPTGGYVVIGDDIQSDGTSKVLLMTVDDTGNATKSGSFQVTDANNAPISAAARAVAINGTGNYILLSTSGSDLMNLAEVAKDDFTKTLWATQYQAGETNLAPRLFVDVNGKIVWSGMATKNGLTGIRLVKTSPNSKFTEFDLLISLPTFNEEGTDICPYGFGYAVTGSTNKKSGSNTPGTDTDILFKRLSQDGTVLQTNSFSFDNQNDTGNSISATNDGGLIVLGSVGSDGLKAAGLDNRGDTDFYLIKIDAFGLKQWESSFGSKYKDDGITVRQTSDGGYVVLGTSTQGGLKIVTLTKTNSVGKIN